MSVIVNPVAGGGGGGSGTVTSVGTASPLLGGPITTAGTVMISNPDRVVTASTDTILASDLGTRVAYNSSGAVAVTLPQAGTTGFNNNFYFYVANANTTATTVTITPTVSTINGAATLVLNQGDWCMIGENQANSSYRANCSPSQLVAGTGISLTPAAHALTINQTTLATAFPVTVTGGVSGGIPYFSSTTNEAASAILNTNVLMKGGGAGNPPTNSSITDNGTTVSTAEQIVSTLATGTSPFAVSSTTNVANLNASTLSGATFAAPGPIGSTTPSTSAFTTSAVSTGFENTTGTAAEQYLQFGRTGVGIPVPYFRPTASNTAIAYDISPNGTPADFSANTGVAWTDICSTDCTGAGVTNYESLRLGKFTSTQSSAVHLSAAQGGTGVVRGMILQLNGGSVGIGALAHSGALLGGTGDTAFSNYCDATHANCFAPQAGLGLLTAQAPLGQNQTGTATGVGLSVAGHTAAEGFLSQGVGTYAHVLMYNQLADNTANTYNFGFYNAAGSLLVSTGAIAGSTFATGNVIVKLAFTGAASITIASNTIYYFAYSAITANTARFSSYNPTLTPFVTAEVSTSSMPGSITAPVVSWGTSSGASNVSTGVWFALVP
jgi:hypothetical protein